MSSADGNGRFGPGAISAAQKAAGGGGGVPSPPPKPGAMLASSLAAQSVAEELAAPAPLPPAAPAPLSDEAVLARIARAGLRQFKREYPAGGAVHTPTGDATTHKLFERNTQGQKVDYVRTDPDAYPGSVEPKKYADIASQITPTAASAALGKTPLSAEESVSARRAATTAMALAKVSETQRNGSGKLGRGALDAIASGDSPAEVYTGDAPGFPQSKPGGMQYHRDVMSGASPVTAALRNVVGHMSDSSDDEEVAGLSHGEAIHRYRLHTETNAVRGTLVAPAGAAAGAGAAPAQAEASPRPRSDSVSSSASSDDEDAAPRLRSKRVSRTGSGAELGLDPKRHRPQGT